jgi:hypothetical protein
MFWGVVIPQLPFFNAYLRYLKCQMYIFYIYAREVFKTLQFYLVDIKNI